MEFQAQMDCILPFSLCATLYHFLITLQNYRCITAHPESNWSKHDSLGVLTVAGWILGFFFIRCKI